MRRREPERSKPSRAFVWFERTVLGLGMGLIAAVVDRVLLRTLKKGEVKPAPRTASGGTEAAADHPSAPGSGDGQQAQLTPPPKQVPHQSRG